MLKKLFLSLAVVSVLAGCSSVPMADAPQDQAAKTFKADAAKSGIYIYRNELLGGAVKMDVSIDGQPVGATKAKTYLFKQVEPGKHTIVSEAENTSVLELDTKPGMLYYIWQEVKMGVMYARNKLQQVSDAQGQAGVMESQLAVTK